MLDLGREQTIVVDGKTWRLGRLDVEVLHGFRDWVKEQVGNPFDDLRQTKEFQTPEEYEADRKEAIATFKQLKGFTFECPLSLKYRGTVEGGVKIVELLLKRNHPEATSADALALTVELGRSLSLEKTINVAKGSLPNGQPPEPSQAPATLSV
jgi:hypothetical protein